MKKLFTLIAALLLTATVWAQSGCPQRMSYQAVVRNAANELVTSTNGIQVTIKITDGTVTYIESHTVNSNQNGLISLMVGAGTVEEGTMDGMDWPNATFTTTVTVPGEASVEATTTVEAVPYALYACEINPNGVNITKIVTDINNHIEDTLNNYYTKNETDSKFETKAALCADVITCVDNAIADGTSTTNLAIDTIVNNQIMKAAADSLISTRELTDSLKNYTETSKLCDYISDNCITEIGERMHTLNVINNSTITIKQGDSELGSFTLNQETPTTITIPTPDAQAQSDWAQTDETKADFIKNKPNIEKIVRDSLADGNSAINHVVDTIVNNNVLTELQDGASDINHTVDTIVNNNVLTELQDGASDINHTVDTIVNNQIMKAAADSLISTRELTDSLSNYKIQDCEDVVACVNTAIADGTSTTNLAIDTIVNNNVLTELQDGASDINHTVDTIVNNQIMKAAADSLISARELKDSLSNYTETSKLCEYITTNCTDLALDSEIPTVNNSTITIKQGDTDLGTFTLNQSTGTTITIPSAAEQAQSDWAQTDDSKADYIKNKPNIEKIVRDSLVNGNSAINHVVDTIVNNNVLYELQDGTSDINHTVDTIVKNNVLTELKDGTSDINHTVDTIVNNQIMKAAADSLISARELTDSLSNYKIQDCDDVISCVDNAIADGTSTTNLAIDTIVKNNVLTELQDGASDINHTVDTIVNNQIMKAAADSLISTRELKDSLNKYTPTNELCDYIKNNCELPTANDNTVAIKTAAGDTIGSFSLNQNTNTSITLPASATVNNGKLTITDGDAYTAEFTANQATNTTVTLGTVAFTNDYTDLSNTPTIPTVNDATVTIKNNGTTIGTFTLNASSAATVNILDRQYSKQYVATAGQTAFTATIPSGYTSINTDSRLIQLYINGVMVGTNLDSVVTVSGTTVTYVPAKNDSYALTAGDRVQIVYWVK